MKIEAFLLIAAVTGVCPVVAAAAACEPPQFEPFRPEAVGQTAPDLVAVAFAMQPVATLRIPSGFSKLGAFPYGSVGFGDHPKGIVGVLGYETRQSVAIHKKDTAPADFVRAIFQGLDEIGCAYMKSQGLPSEEYRLHARLDHGGELFAYGTARTHHFYVIRDDQPDYVVNGMFKNISRAEFEIILSTIEIQ